VLLHGVPVWPLEALSYSQSTPYLFPVCMSYEVTKLELVIFSLGLVSEHYVFSMVGLSTTKQLAGKTR